MCREKWLARYLELKEMKDAIEKEMESLKEKIIEGLPLNEEYVSADGNYSAKYQIILSNRFDSTEFKKSHEDLYEQFKKPSESKRLDVKRLSEVKLPKGVI